MLDFSTDLIVSRAESDEPHEYALEHLDILIFKNEGVFKYHERVLNPGAQADNGSGKVTLNTSVDNFLSSEDYWVYVIANSTYATTDFDNITREVLEAMVETSNNLHLTGTGLANVPSSFLMDGIAFLDGNNVTEPATPSAIKLTNVENQTVSLKVVLRRAASKIVVTFTPSDNVSFNPSLRESGAPGYYMRNLPVKTTLVPVTKEMGGEIVAVLPDKQGRTVAMTSEIASAYFQWNKNTEEVYSSVTLTMYVYSHAWSPSEVFDEGTNLVVNLPMSFDNETYPDNYYQIPLNNPQSNVSPTTEILRFERNTLYRVGVTIGAPGASSVHTPVTVDPIEFSVLPWINNGISVGGVSGPTYLKVNREEMEMYYVDEDATTLRFASSSPLKTIEVLNAYYIDKFGTTQNINPVQYNISATVTDPNALSGNITVKSDMPENNTIRYFTLKISNQDNCEPKTVTVMQYPLVYIVNILGHYSYRDDFRDANNEPTTYRNRGARISSLSLNSYNENTKTWSYNYNNNAGRGFWSSKVVTSDYSVTDSRPDYVGRARIQYYTWGSSGSSPSHGSNTDNPGNARMYRIRLTSTSSEYTLSKPRMLQNNNAAYPYEYTDDSDANKLLVSPSFMTASRLSKVDIQNYGNGLTTDERRLAMARDHCAYYVEVDRDGNVYDNWRLPTASELGIIINLQGSKSQNAVAIDYLLDADYYMSASGLVYNPGNSDNSSDNGNKSQWAIRCVRDAY